MQFIARGRLLQRACGRCIVTTGAIVKATFVRQAIDSNLAHRDGVVSGAATHLFSYDNKGEAQVCSKACDETYQRELVTDLGGAYR